MTSAFWDSRSLVPLCVTQGATPRADALRKRFAFTVWWGTPVEMRSAISRLVRIGQLSPQESLGAAQRLGLLRREWREIQPSLAVRAAAEEFLQRFPLRAADSLQLAAAWIWSEGAPQGHTFLSGDVQLLEAATLLTDFRASARCYASTISS